MRTAHSLTMGGVYLPGGVCTCPGGVPAQGVPARGVPARGGTCLGGVPAQVPPVDRILDTRY